MQQRFSILPLRSRLVHERRWYLLAVLPTDRQWWRSGMKPPGGEKERCTLAKRGSEAMILSYSTHV